MKHTWIAKQGEYQGLVYREEDGKNIAVTYDPADAPIIALLPEIIKALVNLLEDVEYAQPQIKPGLIGNIQIRKARGVVDEIETIKAPEDQHGTS